MAEVYVEETPRALTGAACLLTGGLSEEPPFKRSKSSEEIAPLGSVASSSVTAPLPTPLPTPGLVGSPWEPFQSVGLTSDATAEMGGFGSLHSAESAGYSPLPNAGMAGFASLPFVETAGSAPPRAPGLAGTALSANSPPTNAFTVPAGTALPAYSPPTNASSVPAGTALPAYSPPTNASTVPAGPALPANCPPTNAPTMAADHRRNTDESQNPLDLLRQNGINISFNFNFGNMPPRA